MKKLAEENKKMTLEQSQNKTGQNLTVENKPTEMENLKHQIRVLEDRLKRQKQQSVAEKPYTETTNASKSRSKVNKMF